jgi:flagellar operon protein
VPIGGGTPSGRLARTSAAGDFASILRSKLAAAHPAGELRFSGHARKRIQQRDLKLGQRELSLLGQGVRRAEEKGSREALLLLEDMAFIVNVPNRTVVTALDRAQLRERVFTNIDSTVLL